MHVVLLSESRHQAVLVMVDAFEQITCRAGVKDCVAIVCQNVDVANLHFLSPYFYLVCYRLS